jgi:microcystin-dependent protein
MTGLAWWSQVAANNASIDPTVGMAEGMAPSAVNDGVRALMASASKYRDDIAGALVTSGSSAAYTVTSSQQFDSLTRLSGQVVAFSPHTTNTGACTLNVDSLGAKPLRSAPGVELPAGTIIQGTPYVALFNNSDGALYLQNFYGNPYGVPIGGMLDFVGSTTPNSSFVFPTGQAISRTTYATLFSLTSTTYGSGDGSTTFNVIDMTGRVGAMKEASATRLTSSFFGGNSTTLGATGGLESNTLTTAQLASHSHANTLNDLGHTHSGIYVSSGFAASAGVTGAGAPNYGTPGTSGSNNSTPMSITNANAGSGSAHNNVQPTIIVNKILRVL